MRQDKTFYEHIEELRKIIIKSILTIAILSAIAYFFRNDILKILTGPLGKELIFLSPSEAFIALFKLSIITGAVIAFPYLSYEAWKFVSDIFDKDKKKEIIKYALASLFLFYGAIIFCYFFVLPAVLNFLIAFGDNNLIPYLTIDNYLNFVIYLLISFGLIFQFPLVLTALINLDFVSVNDLIKKRPHIIVAIFIIAAILTPTPDAISLMLMALPMIVLFEATILIARIKRKLVK